MSDADHERATTHEPPGEPTRDGGDRRGAGTAGMPRWVRAAAVIAALAVGLLIVMLALGHGPGRHGHAGRAIAGVVDGRP